MSGENEIDVFLKYFGYLAWLDTRVTSYTDFMTGRELYTDYEEFLQNQIKDATLIRIFPYRKITALLDKGIGEGRLPLKKKKVPGRVLGYIPTSKSSKDQLFPSLGPFLQVLNTDFERKKKFELITPFFLL